jgi:hypothetical protein
LFLFIVKLKLRFPGFDFAVGKIKVSLRESLIRAKPEAKFCLWQIKDSWKQNFAFGKSKILGSKVLPLTNQRFLEAKFCL